MLFLRIGDHQSSVGRMFAYVQHPSFVFEIGTQYAVRGNQDPRTAYRFIHENIPTYIGMFSLVPMDIRQRRTGRDGRV